jgi:hypothetical protein
MNYSNILKRSVLMPAAFLFMLCLLRVDADASFSVRCKNMSSEQNSNLQKIYERIEQRSQREDIESDLQVFLSRLSAICEGTWASDLEPVKAELLTKSAARRARKIADQLPFRASRRSIRKDLAELTVLSTKAGKSIRKFISYKETVKLIDRGERASRLRQASCTSVDFRPALSSEATLSSETPVCTSYTAADLMSFALKRTVSSIGVAFSSYGNHKLCERVNMTVSEAIEKAVAKGICLEKDVPSNDFKKIVESEFKVADALSSVSGPACGSDVLNAAQSLLQGRLSRTDFTDLAQLKPGELSRAILTQDCQAILLPNSSFKVKTQSSLFHTQSTLMRTLDSRLSGGPDAPPQVVAIDYSPQFRV